MYARSTYEGKNLPPVSKLGVIPSQKQNAPITWKSAPYLPKNPFVSPLEIYNTLVHSANPKWTSKSGGIYHPPIIHPNHGIPMPPPQKIPTVTLPPGLINPFRIEPLPTPEPIKTYPTPINCSTLKTCPNGERVSICSLCPTKQKIIVKSPEQEQGSNALGSFISSALMFLPFL